MLQLSSKQAGEFNPAAHGWIAPVTIRRSHFPEVEEDRPMVFQRDFHVRGPERLVIEWERGWNLTALARNGQWVKNLTWEQLQELLIRRTDNNQTDEQFLAGLFWYSCSECSGGAEDHVVGSNETGERTAFCTYNAPRLAQFITTFVPGQGDAWCVRLERVDTGDVLVQRYVTPRTHNYPRRRMSYRSANDIPDQSLRIGAQVMLTQYREK